MTGKITSDMYVEIKQNHIIKFFGGLVVTLHKH